MAQNLVLNILARDKTRAAFNGVRAGLSNLRSAVFSVQSAIVGIGGGLAIKSILNVGSTVEQLRLRFAFLFKGVKEGDKAFQGLIDFASKVPFSLEEIQAGAGNLAVVTKNAEELNEILKLTGNVASVTGLDFRTTAEQIQRSFSSGIGSADLFRERGVRALLGFKAGVQVTTEETKKRFRELFGEGGEFEKATEVLSTSFTGTLSMLSDKLFKFRLDTAQAGFFDFIKQGLAEVNKLIEKNSDQIATFGAKLSESLIETTKTIILTGASIIEAIKPVFRFVALSVQNIFKVFRDLPQGVQTIGLIGFLMLGTKGKGIVLLIGGVFDTIRGFIGDLASGYAFFLEKVANGLEKTGMFKAEIANARTVVADFRKVSERLNTPYKDLNSTIKGTGENLDSNVSKLEEFLATLEANAIISRQQVEEILNKLKGSTQETEKIGMNFKKIAETLGEKIQKDLANINDTIANFIVGGIKQFSRSLAEAVVLGKKLNVSMKELAQKLLVEIIALTIQMIAMRKIEDILIDKGIIKEKAKLSIMQKQESSLKRQIALKAVTSFFGFPGFAKGGAVSKGKPIVVGERGPELFVPNSTGQITQSARGTSGQAVNVNFNISTVDASGFDDLLSRSRGTITQIINSAVNERGREALI